MRGLGNGEIRKRWLAALAVGVAILIGAIGLVAAPAQAQGLSAQQRAVLQARKAVLFQQMLRDPANLDITFAYADVSARLGDNEAAVSALERMLLFNPNLPRVDLELGALYFRMGSFDVARSYFNRAAAAQPPPEVRARISQYLTQINNQQKPGQLSGYVFGGVQYQSDANVAPGSPLVFSPVGPVLLNNQFVKHSDANIFATGAALYSYDLGTQNRDTLEVTGTAYVNHYFQFDNLDLDLLEVTAGPRFPFPALDRPYLTSVSVKPYVILNEVGLGEEQYFDTYGAGIEGDAVLWDVAAKAVFEFRQKNYSNAPDRPLSTGLDGNDKLVGITLTKPVTTNSTVSAQFDFLDQTTSLDFYSNLSYAGSLAYHIRYKDPTGYLKFPWETTVFGSRIWANYEAPDPCCNTSGNPLVFSDSDRYDRHWRFGLTQAFQITNNVAVLVQFQRDVVSSDLSLYAYTSNSVIVGPQIRF